MSRMWFSIGFSFVYIIVFVSAILLNVSLTLDYILYAGGHLIVIWVVFSILRDTYNPNKTFDEYFYQDKEIQQ